MGDNPGCGGRNQNWPQRWNWRAARASPSSRWPPTAPTAPRTARAAWPTAAPWPGVAQPVSMRPTTCAATTYPFLAATGDLLTTGPTQTNVNDLVFVFVR
ncbi:MAG: hypothetical protein R2851_11185 [Caldilineaceae bacterium]